MPDTIDVQRVLSRAALTGRQWEFGPRDGRVFTTGFRFGDTGRIEGYEHRNEGSWALHGDLLEIYQVGGQIMWRSEQVFFNQEDRLTITLRSPANPGTEFILTEYPVPESSSTDSTSPLGAADYLFPKDLQVTPTRFSRILLIGSCLTALYHEQLSAHFPATKFDYLVFNFAGSLPDKPPEPVEAYDFQYVQIPLRSILSDRVIWGARFNDEGFGEKILEDGRGIVDVMLRSAMQYNEASGLLTFVSNFFVPQMAAAPSLAQRGSAVDLAQIVRQLNDYLVQAVSRYKNAFLVDVNAVADAIGKRYLLDDQIYFYSHSAIHFQEPIDRNQDRVPRIDQIPPISTFYESKRDDFIVAIYDQMVATWRTIHQVDQVKAVIFDLDNTLWRGQLAEHYRPDQEDWPKTDGWPLGIWETIHHLRARGILVAICSKNDHEMVVKSWANVVNPSFISLDDFVSVKINWLPKAENIRTVLEEFNIKAKSVVFVDDNPVERAAVKAALPDIRVIGSNPYLTRRILLWAPETQVAFLTKESTRRESMIRNQIVREETRSAMSREEFLATLNCEVTFTEITDVGQPEFGRVLELTNKTNQFNTTAKRWAHAEIVQFLAAGGRIVAFNVSDKFSEYGLVGVLYLEGDTIRQYVMSCRVLGMEVEQCVIADAVARMRANGAAMAITAPLKETPDNTPCREVYAVAGFDLVENNDGYRTYVLPADKPLVRPAHIRTNGA